MSICVACATCGSVDKMRNIQHEIHTGTLYNSVRPRPVRPIVPKEMLSSRIRRYLYLRFSSIYQGNQCDRTVSDRAQLTSLGKSTFSKRNPPRKRPATFATSFLDAQEDVFETFEVVMVETANGRTRNLQAGQQQWCRHASQWQRSHKVWSRIPGSRGSRTLRRGSLLFRTQGPCGHLQSEDVQLIMIRAHLRDGRTNSFLEPRRATATDTVFTEGLFRTRTLIVSLPARPVKL